MGGWVWAFKLSMAAVAALWVLQACSTTQSAIGARKADERPDYQRGLAIYSAHCGGCHDTGRFDAPTLDDGDEWDARSLQWSAVLSEHAKRGFLEMPANGALSERNIREALHYMAITIDANDDE